MREIDLPAYCERIGLSQLPAADLEGLRVLQRAHLLSIPFENLNIPLGRGISLDPGRVFEKLVHERRGGYCFEHNLLFLEVLKVLGFDARPLIGRVWLRVTGDEEGVPALTHRLSLVRIDGMDWIADVGFGGSLAPVLALAEDARASSSDGVIHRLVADADHGWMMERDGGNGKGFQRQYSFDLRQAWPIDFELGNHFTSTAPETLFTSHCFVSMPTPTGFVTLFDKELRLGHEQSRTIDSVEDYCHALNWHFGIALLPEEVGSLGLF